MGFLDIRNVTKSYGAVEVLHRVDIAVEEGEFLVLVGPSGCGKSTLLNMIAGLEGITGGDIERPIASSPFARDTDAAFAVVIVPMSSGVSVIVFRGQTRAHPPQL